MHSEKQDIHEEALKRCCNDSKVAGVLALMIANKEIQYEKLIKLLNPFKN